MCNLFNVSRLSQGEQGRMQFLGVCMTAAFTAHSRDVMYGRLEMLKLKRLCCSKDELKRSVQQERKMRKKAKEDGLSQDGG